MLARLRAELYASRSLAKELMPHATPAFSDATTLLAERLEEAQSVAERLIDSLESLAHNAASLRANPRGKWTLVERDQPEWWRGWRIPASAAVVLLAVLALSMAFRPPNYDAIIPEDRDFPQELEPRAELFNLGWARRHVRPNGAKSARFCSPG